MQIEQKFDTIAVHGGYTPAENMGCMCVPIYQTTAYEFESSQHAKELFELKEPGNIYTRLQNPTNDVLEKRVAMLEGGVGALALASGHAAMFLTFSCIASAGDEIISANTIYGGAINLTNVSMRKLGINFKYADADSPESFEKLITDKTKAIFVEAVANPNANIVDIEAIASIAKKHGILFIVDTTLCTPYLLKPIQFGANIVIHSATKYLGGHGNSMAGIVVDAGNFDFKGNERYSEFNNPDVSYHGIVFADLGAGAFINRLRALSMRDFGPCLSPFNAFLILQGIETLSLRMQRHSENALKIARFLEANDDITFVNYSGLESNKYHELAKKYLPLGQGGMMTFGLKGGKARAPKFIDSLNIIKNVANLGDVRTIISHPATTTHSQLNAKQLEDANISEETIRLSVGIEDVSDLINDISRAIELTK